MTSFTTFEKIATRYMRLIRNLILLIFYVICKATSSREVSILMYHTINLSGFFNSVNPNEFKKQMEYLRENYTIVSLDEMIDFVEGRRNLPRKSVAITFDDGYYDNYLIAYPYFKKYDLPAAIFVITDHRHACPGALLHDKGGPPKMLGWNEIREMSENKIDIGAHTMTHRNLRNMNLEEVRSQILGSKEEIERQIGKKVDYFAYPFGGYDDEIVDLVRTLGFKGVFGGVGSIRCGANVFALNRIQVNSLVTFWMFKMQLTRSVDWVIRIERTASTIISKFNAYFGARVTQLHSIQVVLQNKE